MLFCRDIHLWEGGRDGNISAGVFDFYSEVWKTITTHGTLPPGFVSAASAGSEHYLYTYENYHNIHMFVVITM